MTELLLDPVFLTAVLVAALGAALPLATAAAGETVGEQAGVLNLGIEGTMLIGAFTAYAVQLATGSFGLGFLAGVGAGLAFSLIMLLLSIVLGLNQIVVGLAMTLIGSGLTSVLYLQQYARRSPGTGSPEPLPIPGLSEIPVIGVAVFQQPALFWVCVSAIALLAWSLRHTLWGLSIRAAGQRPASLDAAGGSVRATRLSAVLVGGACAGAGGAALVLLATSAFTPFMTNGLGYLAIVVTMLARGRMTWVVITSVLYGATVAIGTALQLTAVILPADVIKMLPFIVVMITLIVFSRSSAAPPALAAPYTRGAR